MSSELQFDYVAAINDVNGNPQRGWVVREEGNDNEWRVLAFVDEGYEGKEALKKAYPDRSFDYDVHYPKAKISAREYRTMKSRYGTQ